MVKIKEENSLNYMKSQKGISTFFAILTVGIVAIIGFTILYSYQNIWTSEEGSGVPKKIFKILSKDDSADIKDGEIKTSFIFIDGERQNIEELNISLPLDKEEALFIAENLCNQEMIADERFEEEEFYGRIGELSENWLIGITAVDCVCGVLVNKNTGETNCFYNVSSEELDQIIY